MLDYCRLQASGGEQSPWPPETLTHLPTSLPWVQKSLLNGSQHPALAPQGSQLQDLRPSVSPLSPPTGCSTCSWVASWAASSNTRPFSSCFTSSCKLQRDMHTCLCVSWPLATLGLGRALGTRNQQDLEGHTGKVQIPGGEVSLGTR